MSSEIAKKKSIPCLFSAKSLPQSCFKMWGRGDLNPEPKHFSSTHPNCIRVIVWLAFGILRDIPRNFPFFNVVSTIVLKAAAYQALYLSKFSSSFFAYSLSMEAFKRLIEVL